MALGIVPKAPFGFGQETIPAAQTRKPVCWTKAELFLGSPALPRAHLRKALLAKMLEVAA
ncbi:Protein of unknown function [Pyronema omphalodes CBS 100304]|uniref:Uncharacterized protein n=1 Tax=Pyronema omphalodes (strain CBS 100304) TaxID=1076935 RepID=U4L4H7_PYROM|nr:Protein of unknown function [Pyronema omphalodes CBS 100304]